MMTARRFRYAILFVMIATNSCEASSPLNLPDAAFTAKQYVTPATRRRQRQRPLSLTQRATGSSISDSENDAGKKISSKLTLEANLCAGENDVLPAGGLLIGNTLILPANYKRQRTSAAAADIAQHEIQLLAGRNGWGTGVHPTTRLCLQFLSKVLMGGETILDYGCGSGILSIAALKLGAAKAVGVDVEAEALMTCQCNVDLNGYSDRFEGYHTREIVPYCLVEQGRGADVCVANILIGQLLRPSMVMAILTNLKCGAWLCLSGIRPGSEIASLQNVYGPYVEWQECFYAELAAVDTEGSLESFGFDVGTWCRLVGRVRGDVTLDVETMSELAIS